MGVKRGAILSFLTSTPTTGIDSILATYSLMGGIFTVLRILASFSIGVLSGIVSNLVWSKEDENPATQVVEQKCNMKGMAPGAGLVFLIVGPATNTATISFVLGKFGLRTIFVYLGTIDRKSVV